MAQLRGIFFLLFSVQNSATGRLDTPAFAIHQQNRHAKSTFDRPLTKSALFYRNELIPKNEDESPSERREVPIEESNVETKVDEPQENEMWMSATRTLGSLFLHQEDARRDNNTTTNTTGSVSFPFHESTLSSYLLNLKRQEEDNREKAEKREAKKEKKVEKKGEKGKISTEFQIDQVRKKIVCLTYDGILFLVHMFLFATITIQLENSKRAR